MIDIHTHILPGIDDGAQTIEESIEILKKAAEEGIKTIVATPHVLEVPSESDWQKVKNTFNLVKKAIIQEGIDIEIILGAELFISPDLPKTIKENRGLTINNGNKYVLIELPMNEIPHFTEQTIFELQLHGIVPIIAHPERNLEIQQMPNKINGLIQKGVLTQLNAGSLTGVYGRKVQKTARTLLKKNLIHIMASDIHSLSSGCYLLIKGIDAAEKIIGREKSEQLVSFYQIL